MAGMVPGVMVSGSQMLYCFYKAKKNPEKYDGNYHPSFNVKKLIAAAKDAIPAMIMPVIIIGGTLSGVFTATEAGAVAGLYGVIIGVFYYREFHFNDFIETIQSTAFTVGQSSLIFATTSVFSYCIAILKLPVILSQLISGVTTNPYIVMMLIAYIPQLSTTLPALIA